MKFEAEGREIAKFLRSLDKFIQTVKGENNFWYQNAFLAFPGGFSYFSIPYHMYLYIFQ